MNNGSTDNTQELIHKFKEKSSFPVKIANEPKSGRGLALNAGLLIASGEVLIFTDDDCYLKKGYLIKASKIFKSGSFFYCGGRIMTYDKTDSKKIGVNYQKTFELIPPYSFLPIGKIQGTNTVVHKKVVDKIGLFDPMFGTGTPFICDDIDYVARASMAGFTGAHVPGLIVYHHHRYKDKDVKNRLKQYSYGSGAYYLKFILMGKGIYLKNWIKLTLFLRNYLATTQEIKGGLNYLLSKIKRRVLKHRSINVGYIGDANQNRADPIVSIIILSLERGEDLKRNIDSLKKTVSTPYEVIIIDNGSKQKATLNYLKEINDQPTGKNSKISVYYNKTNIGCSAGRKLGIKLAFKSKSKYILAVDNDVTYLPGWLDKLIIAIEKSKKVGAVSPLILNPHRDGKLRVFWNGGKLKIIDNYFIESTYTDGGEHKNRFGGKIYGQDQLKGRIECDWLIGTAMLIRKEVAKQINRSISYLSDFEDYDYSFQIAELGYKMLNVPDSAIIHYNIRLCGRMKKIKELRYLQARSNLLTKFDSLLTLLERTGFNIVKETEFYNRRYNKYFLTRKNYPDLLGPGKSFADANSEEVKKAFETITQERGERGIAAEGRIDMKKVLNHF